MFHTILIILFFSGSCMAENFKLCKVSAPSQCVGVYQGFLKIRPSQSSDTNWAAHENTGAGRYLHNLVSCKVATAEDGTLRMNPKTGASSQGWVLEEVPAESDWDPSYYRLYSTGTARAEVLEAIGDNLRLSAINEDNEGQHFFKIDATYEGSRCTTPHTQGAHGIAPGCRHRCCGPRFVFAWGRCVRVYR